MTSQTQPIIDSAFRRDVQKGLTNYPKFLYSKYIYDETGDRLFQQIMELPEYYLTNCELKILTTHTEEIAEAFNDPETGFDLIELGAGDGKKTKILLHYLADNDFNFVYKPIDISQNAIDTLTKALSSEIPKVNVDGEKGEYFEVLERLKSFNARKKVIVVLGSNIGNLLHQRAIEFLSKLNDSMHKDDLLFMGFDQKKDPQTILNAYNDPTGVTAAFNKNLLVRINKEMDANFDVSRFKHWEQYDPETGTAKSFLVATEAHSVFIKALNLEVEFDKWETIHTEISQKYDDKVVSWLAEESGLKIETSFADPENYYKDYLFRKKKQ
jgi:L-histidine N-alpha-methyltransferase